MGLLDMKVLPQTRGAPLKWTAVGRPPPLITIMHTHLGPSEWFFILKGLHTQKACILNQVARLHNYRSSLLQINHIGRARLEQGWYGWYVTCETDKEA